MIKHFDFNGDHYKIDFYCNIVNGKTTFSIEAPYYEIQTRKVYNRPAKTLDDYMGNTASGYYVIASLRGHKKRIYMY